MKLKKQFDVLLTELNSEKHVKSSYWQYNLRDFHVNEDLTIDGDNGQFGSFQPLSPLRKLKNFNLRENQILLKRGYTLSFSERIGFSMGQSMAKSGSFHMMPRSFSGE